MEDKRAKFMRIFANLPEKIRGEDVIVVADGKPFTWNAAMIEIRNDTELGEKIMRVLGKLGVI